MQTYISFLRGINVSGQKKIKTDDLKKLYTEAGFSKVKNYIQSGNIIFQSEEKSKEKLNKIIRDKIQNNLGHNVEIVIRTEEELESIIEKNPFNNNQQDRLYISFLSEKPKNIPHEKIEERKAKDDKIHFNDEEIYFLCPEGYGKTKLSNNFFENILKVSATTRNWRSSNKILEIAKEISQE